MSKKIATPKAVFNACDELDTKRENWNREDVRLLIGGGGYNVIDPLIKTWKKLKPIREISPSSPTELLADIAESIESKLITVISEIENRDTERSAIFETTSSDYMDTIDRQEYALREQKDVIESMDKVNSNLTNQLEDARSFNEEIKDKLSAYYRNNDELSGANHRLEEQIEKLLEDHELEISELKTAHSAYVKRLIEEKNKELINQKKGLIEQNERSENRLMRLLDEEKREKSIFEMSTAQKIESLNTERLKLKEMLFEEQAKNERIAQSNTQLNNEIQSLKNSLSDARQKSAETEQKLENYIMTHSNSSLDQIKLQLKELQDRLLENEAHGEAKLCDSHT